MVETVRATNKSKEFDFESAVEIKIGTDVIIYFDKESNTVHHDGKTVVLTPGQSDIISYYTGESIETSALIKERLGLVIPRQSVINQINRIKKKLDI